LLLSGSSKNNDNEINHDILNLQESRINDLQTHNETLIRELEDLKKARWYLDDEIKRLEGLNSAL